jgi:hypothetical protein
MSYTNGDDGPEGSHDPGVILRFAQSDETELAKLQSLVDGLVQEINKQQPNVWIVKDGESFLVWFWFQIESCLRLERHEAINLVVLDFLLPAVVLRCRNNISRIFNGPKPDGVVTSLKSARASLRYFRYLNSAFLNNHFSVSTPLTFLCYFLCCVPIMAVNTGSLL